MYSPVIFKCKFVTEFLFLFLVLYTGSELWDTGNNGWFFWVVTGCHVTARDVWTIHLFFSIALSPSLFQRTGFLIFLFFFVIFFCFVFWHPPPVAFALKGSENRIGKPAVWMETEKCLKIIHRSQVTKVHVHTVLCSHFY